VASDCEQQFTLPALHAICGGNSTPSKRSPVHAPSSSTARVASLSHYMESECRETLPLAGAALPLSTPAREDSRGAELLGATPSSPSTEAEAGDQPPRAAKGTGGRIRWASREESHANGFDDRGVRIEAPTGRLHRRRRRSTLSAGDSTRLLPRLGVRRSRTRAPVHRSASSDLHIYRFDSLLLPFVHPCPLLSSTIRS
jgi:hypothetical protein